MVIRLTPYRESPGLCGVASLKMVLDYYGIEQSEAELARLAGSSETHGTSAEGLIAAAKTLGFEGFVLDLATFADIERYIGAETPVIVDWFSQDDGHYSVVVGLDEKNIYLEDPELGHQRSLTRETFFRVWFDFPGDYLTSRDDLILRRIIVLQPQKTT